MRVMSTEEEKRVIEEMIQEDLKNQFSEKIEELTMTLEALKNELSEMDEDDFITDIDVEISRDIEECNEMYAEGKSELWKYKDFESEEHLNKWLKTFSPSIVYIKPSVNERLGFYVKIHTLYL